LSTARALHVITDPQGEVHGDAAMAPARRLPDDKHAADQLRSLVRDTRVTAAELDAERVDKWLSR